MLQLLGSYAQVPCLDPRGLPWAAAPPCSSPEVNANCYGFAPGKSSVLLPGDVLLDVGAHVGTAAALALRTPELQAVCVEPHPLSFEAPWREASTMAVAVQSHRFMVISWLYGGYIR